MYTLSDRESAAKEDPYEKGWRAFLDGDYEAAAAHFQTHVLVKGQDDCAQRLRLQAEDLIGSRKPYRRKLPTEWDPLPGVALHAGYTAPSPALVHRMSVTDL